MFAARFRLLLLPLIGAFAVALWSAPGQADPTPKIEGVPQFGHVFLIVGENTEIGQVNKTNSPYLMGTLKKDAAWLTSYFAVTHFSESNYAAMTSGQYTHCQQFDGSIASCHQDVENIFDQLDTTTVPTTWTSWMESMPAPCYLTSAGGAKTLNHYAPKHNPATFYDNVEGAGGVWSATDQSPSCTGNDLPAGGTGPNDMSAFNHALSTGTVADFNYIVPNECEDGHDNCAPQGNGVTQFDAFLAREVPRIQATPEYQNGGVLIITYDEGTSNKGPGSSKQFDGGGNVIFAVLSNLANPGTYGTPSNHYGLLRTLEDGFGIQSYAGHANHAAPISTIWK